MASNISSGGWRVKITSIPASITFTQLAQIVGLPKSHIYIPKVNNDETHYAWINNFVSEEEANKFEQQWSGSSILGETIKCVVATQRNDERKAVHSSHESLVSDITPSSNKQYRTGVTRGANRRQDNSKPPIPPVPLMSFAASGTASAEVKPPSDHLYRSSSRERQQYPGSGKLSYNLKL
jgi:hypothetical protein